jgi:hypothetical protein
MKRLVFAFLVFGLGAISFGQLQTFTKLVVLKGAASDTVHYVINDPILQTQNPSPQYTALKAQRDALGVDFLALAAKPKVYYFLVAEVVYTPQFALNKWTGEGYLEVWPMGAVEYGIGRHDANGVWQPKLAYAYDIGWNGYAVDFAGYTWWSPKAKARTGDGSIWAENRASTFQDQRNTGAGDGVADLVYTAKLMTNKATGMSWYEPAISSLTIAYTQSMSQLIGGTWQYVQGGAGKVVFKQDAALTTMANDPLGGKVGLGKVATAINALLVKGKYLPFTWTPAPNAGPLDPAGYYP